VDCCCNFKKEKEEEKEEERRRKRRSGESDLNFDVGKRISNSHTRDRGERDRERKT
jgi:hypothetical protein